MLALLARSRSIMAWWLLDRALSSANPTSTDCMPARGSAAADCDIGRCLEVAMAR